MIWISALLGCCLFGAGMAHATITDLRYGRIRNWMVVALAVAWAPLALAAGLTATEIAAAIGMAGLIFAVGFGCFVAGWLGGGDVKLAAVAVLWLGAAQAATFVLLASVLGALLTALLLATRNWRGSAGRFPAGALPRPVPYGPALAVSGLILLQGSPLAAAL